MIIYPVTERHYEGCISKSSSNTYQVRIRTRNLFKTFKTYEDSFEYLKQINIENNYIIKNKIYKYDDYSEVELTKNKKMIIDNDDINKIQQILCFVDERYNTSYVRYRLKNDGHSVPKFVHNYIKDYTPTNNITIDHINGNGLDNRKANIRLATQSLQIRNQVRKLGKSGIKHITPNRWNTYNVGFTYNKKRYRTIFKTLEEAKEWLINKKKEIIPENELLIR
tara:strand:- start:2307 stop:2975 length:669 start_codon:yes stop_codon:yes gene_type:complete